MCSEASVRACHHHNLLATCNKSQQLSRRCAGADHGGGAALLQKALQLVVGVALRDAAARGPEFNGRPFFRVFIGLFNELAASPGAQETAELPYLVGFSLSTLDRLKPYLIGNT